MRRQLIAALAGLSILTLALYIAPRTFVTATLVRDHEQELIDRSAGLISVGLDSHIERGQAIDEAAVQRLVHPGEQLTIERPDGSVIRAGSITTGDQTFTARRELADGSVVDLRLSTRAVEEHVGRGITPIVALAALAVLSSVLASVLLARRLVRPFEALAAHAADVTDEERGPAPRSGMPEADDLAEALDQRSAHVRDLLQREREFSVNASHQLRTPLAALRLRLEDLTLWDETAPEVRAELEETLGEVDRLSATVTDLLEFARAGGIGTWSDVDLVRTVNQSIERWEPLFSNAERRLVLLDPGQPVVAPTSARGVRQILDVLLDNALVHGVGTVELTLERTADHVHVCVGDEGSIDLAESGGTFDRLGATHRSGTGIGLSLAQTIAEAAGARISIASTEPTRFEVKLPAAGRTTEPPPA